MDGLAGQGFDRPMYVLSVMTITLFITFVILVNGVKQAMFKKRNEPPVVFHWLPFIGSAVSYGQEPIRFLSECQAKVKSDPIAYTTVRIHSKSPTLLVWQHLHVCSFWPESYSIPGHHWK